MGTVCAPNYANLFLGHFENKFVFNTTKNPFVPKIVKWFRYIDDIFCIFNGSPEEATDFVTLLNSFEPSLFFTPQYSPVQVIFLDLTVIKSNGSIITTLYRKETDKNTLLLASSFHPTSLKRSLPISQFYRLRRICHSDEDFIDQAQDMRNRFTQRGYPSSWVEHAYELALKKPRSELC